MDIFVAYVLFSTRPDDKQPTINRPRPLTPLLVCHLYIGILAVLQCGLSLIAVNI